MNRTVVGKRGRRPAPSYGEEDGIIAVPDNTEPKPKRCRGTNLPVAGGRVDLATPLVAGVVAYHHHHQDTFNRTKDC